MWNIDKAEQAVNASGGPRGAMAHATTVIRPPFVFSNRPDPHRFGFGKAKKNGLTF